MKYLILIMTCLPVLCGCEDTNLQLAAEAGLDAVRAVTLSDEEVRLLAARAAAESDRQHTLARPGSGYERRLSRLTREMKRVNGRSYDIRAYLSPKVNAFVMADGTIRIYTGLMDRMDDL